MKLTGKARKKFREWYLNCYLDMRKDTKFLRDLAMGEFLDKHKSEQFGVYQDWGDNIGVQITIYTWDNHKYSFTILKDYRYLKNYKETFKTRPQARTEAVKQLNKIVNNG